MHVGIVPDACSIVPPEGVTGADRLREIQTMDGSSRDLLVRNRHIAAASGAGQRLDERGHISGGAWQGDVNRLQAQGSQGGVLHERRERVGDWIAQNGEDAGRPVDHRTVPATRLTTSLISSCSSSYVAR